MPIQRITFLISAILSGTALSAMAAGDNSAPPLAQPEVQRAITAYEPGVAPSIPEPPMPGYSEASGAVRTLPPVAQPMSPEAAPMPPALPIPVPSATSDLSAAQPTAPTAAYNSTASNAASPCPQPCYRNGCLCRDCDLSERPYGACTRATLNAQICAGMRERMVLYQYDFCDAAECDGYKLSPKGIVRLAEIARMLPATCYNPITIEAAFQNPKLDAARRAFVLQTLNQLNVPVPEQLVVVGIPQARGLDGFEALLLNRNFVNDVQSRGAAVPSSSTGTNGSATAVAGAGGTAVASGSGH